MTSTAATLARKNHKPRRIGLLRSLAFLALLLLPQTGAPYSVLTHEQLIDITWKHSIRPLLLSRYPGLTDAQLDQAHAYAYGGCAIQDLGYYPFGKKFFSDLTHYVRSGDFVLSLLRNAQTANELAFAIGALSHYIGDTIGHDDAVNYSVPIEFPDLAHKYGPVVTYADNGHAHIRTEFAFDINEVSKHHFASADYLKHMGLEIPTPLLAKAFFETYGLNSSEVIGKRRPVMRAYRFAVRNLIPHVAAAEVLLHKKHFPADLNDAVSIQLQQDLAQAEIDNGWDKFDAETGVGIHFLAGLIYILPKFGSLSMLSIRGPNILTDDLYVRSLNRSAAAMRLILSNFDSIDTRVPNRDLDTGYKVKPGGYHLTDETYARLLARITRTPTQPIPLGLKQDIAEYYSDPAAPISTKKDAKQWATVQAQLQILNTMPTTTSVVFVTAQIPAL
jgi:hypothetical protein